MPAKDLEDLITQAEAARLRNVSREAIYGLVARGKLQVVAIGGQKFVRRSEVESYTPEIGGRPPAKSEKRATGKANAGNGPSKGRKRGGKR